MKKKITTKKDNVTTVLTIIAMTIGIVGLALVSFGTITQEQGDKVAEISKNIEENAEVYTDKICDSNLVVIDVECENE